MLKAYAASLISHKREKSGNKITELSSTFQVFERNNFTEHYEKLEN